MGRMPMEKIFTYKVGWRIMWVNEFKNVCFSTIRFKSSFSAMETFGRPGDKIVYCFPDGTIQREYYWNSNCYLKVDENGKHGGWLPTRRCN